MAYILKPNALTEFFGKNLNDQEWYIYNAFPDAKIHGKFIVTLRAKKNVIIYNELVHSNLTIKRGGYVRGIVDPNKGCLRVLLYIPTCILLNQECMDLLDSRSLKDVLIQPQRIQLGHLPLKERQQINQNLVQVVRAYIPDRSSCNKLYKTEQRTKRLKKELSDEIIYMPVYGAKYQEYINDPDFRKRWTLHDANI